MGFLDQLVNAVPTYLPDWARSLGPLISSQAAQGGISTIAGQLATVPLLGNMATNPLTNPTQQGPGSGLVPSDGGSERSYSTIRQKMIDHLGFAPRRKTVMFMLRRMGADFTSSALGLDQNDVLWLYTHRRTSSRRHFLQTYTKWIRRGENAKRTLAPLARRAVRHAHRSRHPARSSKARR